MNEIDSGIDLRALRALVAIADAGSFRAAAGRSATRSRRSRTASPRSSARSARRSSRARRTRRGEPHADGQVAYAHARRAIAAIEALEADVGARGDEARATLRVGVFQTAAAELLPPALRAFRRDWPRVEVILTENDKPARLIDQLARGTLDLAFARDVNPTTASRRSR
jgi:DNA-binding transcriptional LysR family regulator